MSGQDESFSRAYSEWESARDAVNQLQGTEPLNVGFDATMRPVTLNHWEWLRDQLRQLANRLRRLGSDENRELYAKAWNHIKSSAEEGVKTATGALRGNFGDIAKMASAALKTVNEAFHLNLGGWALLALAFFMAKSAARDN